MTEDWNGKVGEYTYDEFKEMVITYRARWCRNKLAVYGGCDRLKFYGDKRVVYLDNGNVRLEEIV